MSPPSSTTPIASWSASFFTRLHRYKMLLKRRWYILVFCISAGVAWQAWSISKKEIQYVSTSKLIVSGQLAIEDTLLHRELSSNFAGTQIELMRSADVRSRAAARVKALNPEIEDCSVTLNVAQPPRTNLFHLQAVGTNPAYVQAFLDAIMDEYIRMRGGQRDERSQSLLTMLNTQKLRFSKETDEVEDKLENFHQQHNIVFLEEQSAATVRRLSAEKDQLSELKKEYQLLTLINSEQHLDQQSQNITPEDGSADPSSSGVPLLTPAREYLEARQQLGRMQVELAQLSKNLKPLHPKVENLKKKISQQRDLIELIKRQSEQQLVNRRESLALEIKNLENSIQTLELDAREINAKKNEYERIKRELARVQADHERIVEQMQKVDVGQKIDQEIINILDRASIARPVELGLITSLAQGLAGGFALGLAILFLLDRIDDRVNSMTELRDHLEETVLGQIPLDSNASRSPERSLIIPDDPRHVYAESFRNVRSSLLYMELESHERPKTLLVTSAIPNEGKSTFSANLAITMAFAGSRVLLVDGDLRRGAVCEPFGVKPGPGLTDCLKDKIDWRELVHQTGYPCLHAMTRGTTTPNPGELFLSNTSRSLFDELREAYDYVIVDSAPILATDDTPTLAPSLDGTLFLMRMSFTSVRLTKNALDTLYQRQVNVLGLVLNCVNTNLPEYYYYQYREYYSKPHAASS